MSAPIPGSPPGLILCRRDRKMILNLKIHVNRILQYVRSICASYRSLAVPEVYPDDALGNEKDDGGCSTLKLLSCSRVALLFELRSDDNAVSG